MTSIMQHRGMVGYGGVYFGKKQQKQVQPEVGVQPEESREAGQKKKWTPWHWALVASTVMMTLSNGLIGLRIWNGAKEEQAMLEQVQNRMAFDPKGKDAWPRNTKIYASVLQNYLSRMNSREGGAYTYHLFENLRRPEIRSLDASHQLLSEGLKDVNQLTRWLGGLSQMPVTSTNAGMGWNKDEVRPRYVVLIRGEGNNEREEAMFQLDIERVKSVVKDEFKVPDAHIIELTHPTRQQLTQALKRLSEKQDPKGEVLVYISSHGLSFLSGSAGQESPRDPEGSYEGVLQGVGPEGSMFEFEFKRLFHQYLSHFRAVNLVVDTCYSGAWIARNTASPVEKKDWKSNPSPDTLLVTI